jgi:hypothetical protein
MGEFKDYYETVIEERLSLANKIIKDLTDMSRFSSDSASEWKDKASEYITKLGGKWIGGGSFADVYSGSSGGYVVKLAFDDPLFKTFASKEQSLSNPLFPRILKHASLSLDEEVELYVMERLVVDEDRNYEFGRELLSITKVMDLQEIVHDIMRGDSFAEDRGLIEELDALFREYGRTYAQVVEFGQTIMGIKGVAQNDIHEENFGFDSAGGLVIFDPLN